MTGSVVGNIDVAQVVLYVFWVFFAGLIWYIRQEDRREGYPLESDVSGRYNKSPWLFIPPKKTFLLPHGQGVKKVPDFKRDERSLMAKRVAPAPGYPIEPIGNPLLAGVGPGSWAERSDKPDITAHGDFRIVPLRLAEGFHIVEGQTNPIGMSVYGCDQQKAGTVKDVWVDRAEHLLRYYEVDVGTAEEPRTILLPNNFVVFKTGRGKVRYIYVHAITSGQFADVPKAASSEAVTLREEDRITGYFGAGLLYALRRRQEAVL
ncbi:photosynthetic reaction center subunit H [Peteryoungia desertarenae]|uniref:Photosynthetic reaction center subunit H n=1 Tax=Peteryoungia desertarenae TaxID=1813451 RepID=A0ABX6QJN5_9HYPH|nr:photosynthetic reaction center subunit H [Peteryoungia desertarenae]QLF68492.1 photosynthetic reaction center subunit H [Peteryoungia desertarenae]